MSNKISRRGFLRAAGVGATGVLLAACQPEVVEKIVKETVIVEQEKVVTEVVKETVVVEGESKEVTKVVEKVVTTTPAPVAPVNLVTWKWVPGTSGTSASAIPDDDSIIKVDLEKALNITQEIWWLERATYVEQLSTRFAGGEYVDWGGTNFGDTSAFHDQGLFGKITLTDLATYAPRYFKGLSEWNDNALTCFHGGLRNGVRFTYGQYVLTQIYPFAVGWRKDILDKMGMAVPEKLEETDEALHKMVADGYVKYAARFRGADYLTGAFREISAAFGVWHENWSSDGKGGAIPGIMHPGHKDGLKVVQGWYKDGLINPESATSKNADIVQSWCQGEYGYMTHSTWYRCVPGGEHYDCLVPQGMECIMGGAPVGPNGDHGFGSWTHGRPGSWIMKHLDRDPVKKAKVLEGIELTGADPEWAEYVTYGKPEWHKRDPETNAMSLLPEEELPVERNRMGLGMGFTHYLPQIEQTWVRSDFPEIWDLCDNGTLTYYPDISAFTDWTPCKDYTELGNIANTWRLDFIMDVKEVNDANWDAFVNEYMSNGGECQVEAATKGLANQDGVDKSIKAEVEGLLASA